MAFIATGAQLDEYPHIKRMMFRKRKLIFHDMLGWAVDCDGDEERDIYDHPGTVYVINYQHGDVLGMWRLLPTTGSYMLRDIWPDYADGYLPSKNSAWELSRFFIDREKVDTQDGFERVALDMFCTMAEFLTLKGVDEVIMLQDPSITYLSVQIFGIPHIRTEPRPAGKTNAQVVAFRPSFQRQRLQAAELFNFPLPSTDAYDLSGMAAMKIAAE